MNWRDRLNNFMQGRYGQDQLSRFMLMVSLVFLILGFFVRIPGLSLLVLVLLGIVYYRMLSRNISARYAENQKYLALKGRFLGFFKKGGQSQSDGTNMIFRCPKCSQKIRIPRGKGMVEITCPKCRTKFRKRT